MVGFGSKTLDKRRGKKGEKEGGHNGNQMFQADGGWPLCYCVTSHPSPPHTQPSKVCHSSLTSFCPLQREGKKKGGGGAHARAHTYTHTYMHAYMLAQTALALLFSFGLPCRMALED